MPPPSPQVPPRERRVFQDKCSSTEHLGARESLRCPAPSRPAVEPGENGAHVTATTPTGHIYMCGPRHDGLSHCSSRVVTPRQCRGRMGVRRGALSARPPAQRQTFGPQSSAMSVTMLGSVATRLPAHSSRVTPECKSVVQPHWLGPVACLMVCSSWLGGLGPPEGVAKCPRKEPGCSRCPTTRCDVLIGRPVQQLKGNTF